MLSVIGANIECRLCSLTQKEKLMWDVGYKLSRHYMLSVLGQNDLSEIKILLNNFC